MEATLRCKREYTPPLLELQRRDSLRFAGAQDLDLSTPEHLAIARRLLERGEMVEDVAELTGLSPEDVRKLAQKH